MVYGHEGIGLGRPVLPRLDVVAWGVCDIIIPLLPRWDVVHIQELVKSIGLSEGMVVGTEWTGDSHVGLVGWREGDILRACHNDVRGILGNWVEN